VYGPVGAPILIGCGVVIAVATFGGLGNIGMNPAR